MRPLALALALSCAACAPMNLQLGSYTVATVGETAEVRPDAPQVQVDPAVADEQGAFVTPDFPTWVLVVVLVAFAAGIFIAVAN